MNCVPLPRKAVEAAMVDGFPGGRSCPNTAPKETISQYAPAASPTAAAKKQLICEYLRVVAVKAQCCASSLDIEDYLSADHDMRLAIKYLCKASFSYRELRAVP